MMLLKIGIFDITFLTIFTFVLGIATSIAVVSLIYLVFVLNKLKSKDFEALANIKIGEYELPVNLNKKEKKMLLQKNKSTENAYKSYELVLLYQKILFDNKLRKGRDYIHYTFDLSKSLINNIAAIYFPESEKPMFEISIKETIELSKYLSKRISEILDYSGLKFIRRINVNSIINIRNLSMDIYESNAVQTYKRMNVDKIMFGFKVLLNIVNPIYWVRKAMGKTAFRVVNKKLSSAVLQVVGEESYKIYSKDINVFNTEEDDFIEI